MSGPGAPSAAAGIWPRGGGSTTTGPTPNIGYSSTTLPVVNNASLPPYNFNSYPTSAPPIPPSPSTPFPQLAQLNTTNTSFSNNYPTQNSLAANNAAVAVAQAAANANQKAQNEVYKRRLDQLEDENALRRNATANMQQVGVHILQGQMDVQEQVLEYQFMLEQCMNTLDSQNQVLTEQAEELALLRSKMRHLEYLMDAFKASKEGTMMMQSMSRYGHVDNNNSLCCGEPLSLPPPSTSPYFTGTPTRITASTFQPFNPRYRSPTNRAKTVAAVKQNNNITPANNTPRSTTAVSQLARRFDSGQNS